MERPYKPPVPLPFLTCPPRHAPGVAPPGTGGSLPRHVTGTTLHRENANGKVLPEPHRHVPPVPLPAAAPGPALGNTTSHVIPHHHVASGPPQIRSSAEWMSSVFPPVLARLPVALRPDVPSTVCRANTVQKSVTAWPSRAPRGPGPQTTLTLGSAFSQPGGGWQRPRQAAGARQVPGGTVTSRQRETRGSLSQAFSARRSPDQGRADAGAVLQERK